MQRVTFTSGGLELAGDLRVPDGAYEPLPALVFTGPLSGVKDQVVGTLRRPARPGGLRHARLRPPELRRQRGRAAPARGLGRQARRPARRRRLPRHEARGRRRPDRRRRRLPRRRLCGARGAPSTRACGRSPASAAHTTARRGSRDAARPGRVSAGCSPGALDEHGARARRRRDRVHARRAARGARR